MKPESIKFKKNESFYIRDGWFEKAINTIEENANINIFAKNNGILMLGIGSNMVKGLRYWLQASNLITLESAKTALTNFGKCIFKYDRYFEDNFTWFLIHYFLCINYEECPIFYGIFNNDIHSFKKNEAVNFLKQKFSADGYDTKEEYIDLDTSIFLKSYINDEIISNPEDNYVCPLSSLKFLKKNKDKIEKTKPLYHKLSYLIVYYALLQLYPKIDSFKIEDSFTMEKSPYLLFNLDKNMYLQYLEQMRNNDLITINRTAGLNTVYFEKRMSLEQIFNEYFGG